VSLGPWLEFWATAEKDRRNISATPAYLGRKFRCIILQFIKHDSACTVHVTFFFLSLSNIYSNTLVHISPHLPLYSKERQVRHIRKRERLQVEHIQYTVVMKQIHLGIVQNYSHVFV